ncbi:phospholipase D family protein [Pigmentiphaga aceris]|uniref:Phospholipase D family protein n=1 Tax=Pigmentiphaga aceris TaxID=1940612 RepID=A0A5C0AZ18_9BURK|nr:phospholipase D family protein [Pigmentiphaga aceris]QEI06834.1 phospholipase D family protein [Pigmentiphaga aceris]
MTETIKTDIIGAISATPSRSLKHLLGGIRLLAAATALTLLAACGSLPSLEGRPESSVLRDTADTRLGRAVGTFIGDRKGVSGIHTLSDGRAAFASRVLLADTAERSLDVQYYIWHDDMSGTLLLDALARAAERGVRVRLLLDDNGAKGLDKTLAVLDAHPNMEVRLFNPFVQRSFRAIGYVTDFSRLNRRMHNKSMTADNQATIIGGRNIADEYFDVADTMSFADLDVMAVGPVVNDVSTDFDRYWASASSYPVKGFLSAATDQDKQRWADHVANVKGSKEAVSYQQALSESAFVKDLMSQSLHIEWAATRMISDDPAKGLGEADKAHMMPHLLRTMLGTPKHDLVLVSSYFVPTDAGVKAFGEMAKDGVGITILTNSLEATDVAVVHAGYAKHRKALLEQGIHLFEMKRNSPDSRGGGQHSLMGSSSSSLHAKTFSVDGQRVYVGSYNFDPRSAKLNTEMGFVIDSSSLAQTMARTLAERMPESTYTVTLSADGDLQWREQTDTGLKVHDTEPGTSFLQRMGIHFLSILPIEWML